MSQTLPKLPAAGPLIIKALQSFSRKPGADATVPPLSVSVPGVVADAANVAAYRRVCGFADSSFLPITYPQVQAISLHLWLMTQPEFPFALLGLVHLRNRTDQVAPLPQGAPYEIRASLGPGRRIPGGLIFDLITEHLDASGAVMSKSVTTPLVRLKTDQGKGKLPEAKLPPMDLLETFDVPANTGRRYARVSGDFNPIHLSALTSRLFGFKQAIAHGMWSVARCASALERELAAPPTSLTVQYRGPILLPTTAALRRSVTEKGVDFALGSPDGEKLFLNGQIR
jgi:hypothetical protein